VYENTITTVQPGMCMGVREYYNTCLIWYVYRCTRIL